MLRTMRRRKEQPSVYKMTYRAARLGYTLVETFGPPPENASVLTVYSGWPNGTDVHKIFTSRTRLYNWLSKIDNKVN